ncbi:MAG: sugar phosphate nucleotidyltransferase [bacterium]
MKSHQKITKAVIAAAGYGTRFLPATKNQPKEMLPIIDKPIIQYLVEEAVDSGITDIILVTRSGQSIMEDYFDNNVALEQLLEKNGKIESLVLVREIPQIANFVYVRQKRHLPYGNATPLLAVKNLIDDDEAFVYMFGDDLTLAKTPVTKQLIDVYEKEKPVSVLAVQEVPDSEVHKYGTVRYKQNAGYKYEIEAVVEKAPAGKQASNMAVFGRFIFSYKVVEEAEKLQTGLGGELWVSDMNNNLAQQGEKVIAQPIQGEWLTTGDPLAYLKTTLRFALEREALAKDLRSYIQNLQLKAV